MIVALMLLISLGCTLPLITPPGPTPEPTRREVTPVTPEQATATLAPTVTPTRAATFTPTPLAMATPTPTPTADPRLSPEDIELFPWPLYAGDRLSVDVDPVLPEGLDDEALDDMRVTVTLPGSRDFSADVIRQGLDGVAQARFYWVTELPEEPGTHVFTVTLVLPPEVEDADPDNNTTVLSVPLHAREALPPPEPEARWVFTETAGFSLHYLTGSSAERDLTLVLEEARLAHDAVTSRLGESDDQVDIYLLDRVVGQGGYAAADWVAVSYTDRRYSPVALGSVLRHELTHRLDDIFGCDEAPTVLREGLAVYVAGGHYRSEPLRAKAGTLPTTSAYIPLGRLVQDFYTHQHEAAYLEAGSAVQYLVETHGWDAIATVCEAAAEAGGTDMARWDAGLAALDMERAEFETGWLAWLDASQVAVHDQALLELELRLMDTMRAYQAAYDPAAHYLEGLLFSPEEGAREEIVADFVRRPRDPEPVGLELVLAMGQEAVEQRDPVMLAMLVDDLKVALSQGIEQSEFVRDAVQIAELALEQGWEPYRMLLEQDRRYLIYVLNRGAWPQQSALIAQHNGSAWEIRGIEWPE